MNQQITSKISRMSAIRQHCLPVLWVAGIGIGLSLTAFFVIRSWEHRNIEKSFRAAADDRTSAVKGAFETELAMLELVRSSLISDGRIEREEFREILVPFLSRSHDIRAVEWVPRVPGSRRAEYEAAARRDGIKGFQFTEMDKRGDMVVAQRREEYFPIFFIGPHSGNQYVYGYDVGSESSRLATLRLACDTGKNVASARIAFVRDEHGDGFIVCLPVYEKDKPTETVADRRKHLMGFILGVFRPNEMINSALATLQPEGIDVGLIDPSDLTSKHFFQFHASRSNDDLDKTADTNRLLDPKGLRYLVPLDVAGAPWTLVCAPTPGFQAAHRTWWPAGALVAGLMFTTMLVGYLLMSIEYTLHLEQRVREQTADVRSAQEEVLFRLASASQHRDEETGMHIRRTGLLSQALARAVGWIGDELEVIHQAAPMHDIGKIGIPDAILRKPDKLTPAEFEVMKTHTTIGAEILAGSKVPMLQMAREIALNHHERWDGKGYPRGVAGKNIPESARIVTIVDCYDALTHDRVNRLAISEDVAVAIMQQESEKQFDPELLAEFFRHLPEMRRLSEQNAEAHVSHPAPTGAKPVSTAPLFPQPSVWSGQSPAVESPPSPWAG
jgi:CHASE1-domain containing sensor protein